MGQDGKNSYISELAVIFMRFLLLSFSLFILLPSCESEDKILYDKAEKAMSLGDYVSAEKHLSKLLKIHAGIESVLYQRALCYLELKKYSNAIRDLNNLVFLKDRDGYIPKTYWKLRPETYKNYEVPYEEILYNRGQAYFHSQQYLDAIIDFQFLVDEGYLKSNSLLWLGISHIKNGNQIKGCEFLLLSSQWSINDDEKNEAANIQNAYCK